MNHATWSVGSLSTPPWKASSHPRPSHSKVPPRPGSASPRREKKRINVPSNSSPPLSALRNPQNKTLLAMDESNLTKSPSAPNLHATSMLVLQGSLAGFAAMAVGNVKQRDKGKKNARNITATQRPLSSPDASRIQARIIHSPTETIASQQSLRKCNISPLTSARRVKSYPIKTPNEESNSEPITWQERRIPSNDTHTGLPHPTDASHVLHHNRNLVFKETSV